MSEKHPGEQDFGGRFEVAVRSILSPTTFGRKENQDNYLIIDAKGTARFLENEEDARRRIDHWPEDQVRLAVLDGLGGHSHGRQATEKSVQGILEIPAQNTVDGLAKALESLHRRLNREMHGAGEEPGCTLTLLEIPPAGPALLFHAGDSRLYAVDSDAANCLTIDHVPATKLAMLGKLDEGEWVRRVHVQSGYQISQAFVLGNTLSDPSPLSNSLDPDLFALHDGNLPDFLQGRSDRRHIELQPDRVYLLASDGLWHLPDPLDFVRRWPELLAHPDKPLEVLLDKLFAELVLRTQREAQLGGDNSTAVAFRLRS